MRLFFFYTCGNWKKSCFGKGRFHKSLSKTVTGLLTMSVPFHHSTDIGEQKYTLFFPIRDFFQKQHEAEIYQKFKNQIRECPGLDSVFEIFEEFTSIVVLKQMTIIQIFQ